MNLRIDKRVYKAVITGIATLTSRGASVIVSLLSIPILAGYLGTERFGLWLIFSTLMGWILIFDLGIANSITNVISSSDTENNKDKIRITTSSAIFSLSIIAFLIIAVVIVSYNFIPWSNLFNVKSSLAKSDAKEASLVFIILFAIRIPRNYSGLKKVEILVSHLKV